MEVDERIILGGRLATGAEKRSIIFIRCNFSYNNTITHDTCICNIMINKNSANLNIQIFCMTHGLLTSQHAVNNGSFASVLPSQFLHIQGGIHVTCIYHILGPKNNTDSTVYF